MIRKFRSHRPRRVLLLNRKRFRVAAGTFDFAKRNESFLDNSRGQSALPVFPTHFCPYTYL